MWGQHGSIFQIHVQASQSYWLIARVICKNITKTVVGSLPLLPNMAPSVFLSFVVYFWFGFSRHPKNLGGNPYLRILSVKSLIAQICIQALNACTRQHMSLELFWYRGVQYQSNSKSLSHDQLLSTCNCNQDTLDTSCQFNIHMIRKHEFCRLAPDWHHGWYCLLIDSPIFLKQIGTERKWHFECKKPSFLYLPKLPSLTYGDRTRSSVELWQSQHVLTLSGGISND